MSAVTVPLLAYTPEQAAQAVGLSVSQVEKLTRQQLFPQLRQLSARRVAYVAREVEEWLVNRPASECLPPKNSGYGRAGKPKDDEAD